MFFSPFFFFSSAQNVCGVFLPQKKLRKSRHSCLGICWKRFCKYSANWACSVSLKESCKWRPRRDLAIFNHSMNLDNLINTSCFFLFLPLEDDLIQVSMLYINESHLRSSLQLVPQVGQALPRRIIETYQRALTTTVALPYLTRLKESKRVKKKGTWVTWKHVKAV